MFTNIGGKIKGLAEFVCGLGILASIIAMLAMWSEEYWGMGILILIGGCLVSWIGSFAAYALGEITENSERQVELLNQLCNDQKILTENLSELQRMMVSDNRTEKSEEPKNVSAYLPEL